MANSTRIDALTGLRGVAALWVAAYHLLLPAALVAGWPARVLGRGYLAVDLFFALSGFVLARTYGARFCAGHKLAGMADFLRRRLARIFPLYALILLARLGYTALRYGSFNLPRPWLAAPLAHPWLAIPANLLLVQSWGVATSSIGPAWSVSTEWAAYWAFPVIALLMLHARRAAALAGAGVAAGLVLAAAHHGHLDAWDGRTAGPVLRCLGGFTLGVGVWRLSTWPPAARLAGGAAASWCVAGCLAAGLALGAPDLAIYPIMPAVILVFACGRSPSGQAQAGQSQARQSQARQSQARQSQAGQSQAGQSQAGQSQAGQSQAGQAGPRRIRAPGPARLLAAPGLVWLGDVSYALYLLHIFLLHPLDQARAACRLVLPPHEADALAACLILVLLLAAAEVAHRLVERPARAWLEAAPRRAGTVQASFQQACSPPAGARQAGAGPADIGRAGERPTGPSRAGEPKPATCQAGPEHASAHRSSLTHSGAALRNLPLPMERTAFRALDDNKLRTVR